MMIRQIAFATLVALATVTTPVQAQQPMYYGFKAGLMNPDAVGHDNLLNVGGLFGLQIVDEHFGTGAVEAEATTTLVRGDRDAGGKWSTNTVAIYFAFRTAGDAFFKAKAGVANQTIGHSNDVPEGSNFTAGIGVGLRANKNTGVEFELTEFDRLKFLSLGFFQYF